MSICSLYRSPYSQHCLTWNKFRNVSTFLQALSLSLIAIEEERKLFVLREGIFVLAKAETCWFSWLKSGSLNWGIEKFESSGIEFACRILERQKIWIFRCSKVWRFVSWKRSRICLLLQFEKIKVGKFESVKNSKSTEIRESEVVEFCFAILALIILFIETW